MLNPMQMMQAFGQLKAAQNPLQMMQQMFSGDPTFTRAMQMAQGKSPQQVEQIVRYENSQQTCEIANAIHAEGEATRALINANVMQDLRDRLQDEKLANSQCAQNAYLINQLQPVAKPAYITCSPYAASSGCCGGY